MSVGVGLCFASLLQACLADTTKASKSTQTPQSSSMINWANLDVVDYLRSGALIVAFLAILLSDTRGKGAGRGGKKNMWVNAEVVAFFLMGMACFFFPTSFLEYFMKAPLNALHLFCVQGLGCLLVGHAVLNARLQRSIETNGVVHAGWLLASLIGSGCLLVFQLGSHKNLTFFKDQDLTFHVLAILLWFGGCVYQFLTADKLGGNGGYRGLSTNINFYLVAELLITMIFGVVSMVQPQALQTFMTIKFDAVTTYLSQGVAIHLLIDSLMTFGALFYSDSDDKKEIFFSRLVVYALYATMLTITQLKHGLFTSNGLMLTVALDGVRVAVLLQGYYTQ